MFEVYYFPCNMVKNKTQQVSVMGKTKSKLSDSVRYLQYDLVKLANSYSREYEQRTRHLRRTRELTRGQREQDITFGDISVNSASAKEALRHVIVELSVHHHYVMAPHQLSKKMPVIELVYKLAMTINAVDRLPLLISLLNLSNEKVFSVDNGWANFSLSYYGQEVIFSAGDAIQLDAKAPIKDGSVSYATLKAIIANPIQANAVALLVMFAKRFEQLSLECVLDECIFSENICHFMLKLVGLDVDIKNENIANYWQKLDAEIENHLVGFFDWALLNAGKITDEIIESLEMLRPDNHDVAASANYSVLAAHGVNNTLTISRSALQIAFDVLPEKDMALIDVAAEKMFLQDGGKTSSYSIPTHRLQYYHSVYDTEMRSSECDKFALALISGGEKRVESWFKKLLDLDVLTYQRYRTIVFRLDKQQQQVYFDNLQCMKIYLSDSLLKKHVAQELDVLRAAEKPQVDFLFNSLIVDAGRSDCAHLYFAKDGSVIGGSYVELITNLLVQYKSLDKAKLNNGDHKHGLIAAAMWCKHQDSVECGMLLGEIISLVSSYAQIIDGDDLHPNVQTGLLMARDSSVSFQFFDSSSKGWVDARAEVSVGFSQVCKGN
jgi:hypothetical protein